MFLTAFLGKGMKNSRNKNLLPSSTPLHHFTSSLKTAVSGGTKCLNHRGFCRGKRTLGSSAINETLFSPLLQKASRKMTMYTVCMYLQNVQRDDCGEGDEEEAEE